MVFCNKDSNRDNIMTEKDEKDSKNDNIYGFCWKEVFFDKVTDHRYLTGSYGGPAHRSCNINFRPKQIIFVPIFFTILTFDKINSFKRNFYRIGELNGSSYVKSPMRSNAILNFQNDDKYCFIWSLLAYFNPMAYSKIGLAKRVSN